jgi:hypothetical protein
MLAADRNRGGKYEAEVQGRTGLLQIVNNALLHSRATLITRITSTVLIVSGSSLRTPRKGTIIDKKAIALNIDSAACTIS